MAYPACRDSSCQFRSVGISLVFLLERDDQESVYDREREIHDAAWRVGVVDVMPYSVARVRRHALVEIPVLQVGYNIKHFVCVEAHCGATGHRDRKSTRLNSSPR